MELVCTKESDSIIPDKEGPDIGGSVSSMDPTSCGGVGEGSGSCSLEVHHEKGCYASCTPDCDTKNSEACTEKHYDSEGDKSDKTKHCTDIKLGSSKISSGGTESVTDNLDEVKTTKESLERGKGNSPESSRNVEDMGTRTGLTQDLIELNATHINESECGKNIGMLPFATKHDQDITSQVDRGDTLDSVSVFEDITDGTQTSGHGLKEQTKQGCSNDLRKQEEVDVGRHLPNQVEEGNSCVIKEEIEKGSGENLRHQVNRISTEEAEESSNRTDVRTQNHEDIGNVEMQLIKEIEDSNLIVSTEQGLSVTETRVENIDDCVREDIEEPVVDNVENQEEALSGNDLDAEMSSFENDEPSEDLHTVKLGKICRICGEMTVKYDGPKKGVPKQEVVKHVKKVWNVDISNENSDVYPINVCLSCERKIKRIYLKVSKRKKCEFFRDKPAEFVEHSGSDCPICLLKEANPLPVLSSESFQVSEALGGDGCSGSQGHEAISKATGQKIQAQEPRRSLTRKRSREELRDAFQSVGIQTEDIASLDSITGLEEHDYTQEEALRQYLAIPKKTGGRTPYQKQSLCSVNAKYIRQDRLKPLISHIDKFCQVHKEDKIDVMFFLLIQTLRDANDRARENLVTDIWCKKSNLGVALTDEECLAKRILLKQTKEQYRKEYSYYKEKLDKSVLKPPFIIDRLEKTYFPEHLDYFVTDGKAGPLIYQHEKSTNPSHFTITDANDGKAEGGRGGNIVGARWYYFDAVAKTLEELSCYTDNDIQDLDEDTCIHVDIMDYFEEKRDMTNLHDKGADTPGGAAGRTGQCKMMTYSFGVQSMQAVVEDKVTPLYRANSATTLFRPLMKAIVSEGSAINPTCAAIEMERAAMANKIFHITLPSGTPLRFMVNFINSAAEMRKDYR